MSEKNHLIDKKIKYQSNVLYKFDLNGSTLIKGINEGSEINEGINISEYAEKPEYHDIKIKGKVKVGEGDEVEKDKIVSQKKMLFYKKEQRSPVDGYVEKIEGKKLVIKEKIENDTTPPEIPFNSKIRKIKEKFVILEFPAVVINLFDMKGYSITGEFKYIDSEELKDKKNLPKDVKGKVIVTDYIHPSSYPLLSTLGVKGLIVNSLEYELFNDMIILAVPIGIISGFGSLTEDEVLVNYLRSKSNQKVWFDCDYGRLIIPEDDQPEWINDYKFDLKKVGIIKE